MNHFFLVVIVAVTSLFLSCSRKQEVKDSNEYANHYLQAQHDYCSTNIAVAEKGLLQFRDWILKRDAAGKPRENYYLNLVQVNARLLTLYEFQGKTNEAKTFYEDGARAYQSYLRNQHLPEHPLSREDMQERLARQEKGLQVGWKQ